MEFALTAVAAPSEAPSQSFDYFMIYYSIILGMAVTELFSGLGRVVQARTPLREAKLTLFFCGVVFLETVSNFIDVWDRPEQVDVNLITIGQYTAVGGASILLALIAVPSDISLRIPVDEHFRGNRRIFGLILILGGAPVLLSDTMVLKECAEQGNAYAFPIWLVGNVVLFTGYCLLTWGTRSVSALISIAMISFFYFAFYIDDPTDCFDDKVPGWFGLEFTARPSSYVATAS